MKVRNGNIVMGSNEEVRMNDGFMSIPRPQGYEVFSRQTYKFYRRSQK